jgi:hypothetical protein
MDFAGENYDSVIIYNDIVNILAVPSIIFLLLIVFTFN